MPPSCSATSPGTLRAGVIIAREAGAEVVDKDGSYHDLHSSAAIAPAMTLMPPVLGLLADAEAAALLGR